jgi:hypothetical protein
MVRSPRASSKVGARGWAAVESSSMISAPVVMAGRSSRRPFHPRWQIPARISVATASHSSRFVTKQLAAALRILGNAARSSSPQGRNSRQKHAKSQYLLFYCLTASSPTGAWSAGAAARCHFGAEHPRPAFWCDLIRVRAWSLASGQRAVSCQQRRAIGCGQGSTRTAHWLAVHKHVYDLCATALSLCMLGGNAGDYAAWSCL